MWRTTNTASIPQGWTHGIGTPAHEGSKACRWMAAQQAQHKVVYVGVWAAKRRFMAYEEHELRSVLLFKYAGRVVLHDNNNIPAMRRNFKRARATWGRVSKIIICQSVTAPIADMFYQAVVVAILLYRNESWY